MGEGLEGRDAHSEGGLNVIHASNGNYDKRRLHAWLDKVTRGLSEDACERIRDDIMSHYQDVYDEARMSGQCISDANEKAYGSLGSARVARRGFRRVYFTTRERERLNLLFGSFFNRQTASIFGWAFVTTIMAVSDGLELKNFGFPIIWVFVFLADLESRFAVRRKRYRRPIAQVYLMPVLMVLTPIALYFSEFPLISSWEGLLLFELPTFVFGSYATYLEVKFWRKLEQGVSDDES